MLRPTAVSALGGEFGAANVIGSVAGTTVIERSDLGALLISACVDGCEPRISEVVGVDLPTQPGRFLSGRSITAIWLSPRSWILQCAIEDEMSIQKAVLSVFPDDTVHGTGFTDQLCWLELSGGDPQQLLCRGAFVSLDHPGGLPVGRSKRTLVADVAVVILRPSTERLLVGVERSRARFFRDWLLRVEDEAA